MKNKTLIILFMVLLSFVFNSIYSILKKDKSNSSEIIISSNSNLEKENKENDVEGSTETKSKVIIQVDIKGAVKKPGVYEVNDDLRVNDIITMAGGLNKNANTNYINLSARVRDEMVIWIYTNEEIDKLQLGKNSVQYMIQECNCPVVDNTTCLNNNEEKNNVINNNIVNINTASLEELTTLDGIGESKAKNIIDYRNKNGNFLNKEDIMNVSGIGESAYNKIKDNITV